MAAAYDAPEQVKEALDFYAEREGAESKLRQNFADDLRFAFQPGAQWDSIALAKRQGRPNYTYNRVAGAIHGLVGEQRMVQPSGKVRPTTQAAAMQTAEIFGGLIRDIEFRSSAPTIYAEQFKYSVAGGFGYWRIAPQYADDESFDQVLRVIRVPNPQTVMLDGQADPFGRGGMRALVSERMAVSAYKAMYGDDKHANFPMQRDQRGWYDQNQIRVAELYCKKREQRVRVVLTDGRTFWEDEVKDEIERAKAQGIKVADVHNSRPVDFWSCEWSKVDGCQVLEGPYTYEYKHIPIVRLPGRHINIEGEDDYQSLIRHAKDPAKTYNYNRSSMVETVSLTPRAPWILTAKMIAGYEDDWNRANVSNSPYLLYNVDEDSPQLRPERNAGPEVPQAYIALALHDAEDIKHATGYSNPAVEQQTRAGDAESGRALRTRLMTGDSGSYEFLDNFAKAVQYGWEIMIDMIPVVYSTKRVERIIGTDGREDFVEITPELLKKGKFDTAVSLGPAHATARMEALDTLLDAAERMPILLEEAPDIIVRNMDIQAVDEIEQRIRMRLIAEGRIQPTKRELEAGIQPPPPDAAKAALVQRLTAQAKKDEASTAKITAEAVEQAAVASTAEKRQLLELAELVANILLTKASAAEKGAAAAETAAQPVIA